MRDSSSRVILALAMVLSSALALAEGARVDGNVKALAWDGASLYAGGEFTSAGGAPAYYVAQWDGFKWSALGSGMDGFVWSLQWDGTGLYAGGYFLTAGG